MVGNIVCLVNRTPHVLHYVKNGREFQLQPGENWVNSDHVRFAKAQNPVPGSRDPQDLKFDSLVGLKQKDPKLQRDPLDPIDEETLAMLPKELINRALLPLDRQNAEEVRAPFPHGRVGIEAPSVGQIEPGKFGSVD